MTTLTQRLRELQQLAITEQHAARLDLLASKLNTDQTVLAFCGHFSAGKSTLINQLAGSQILPASPIPTSANQVLIRHGDPGATVRFRQQGEVELAPSELGRLAALCADGDAVEAVELRHPLAHVPEGLWVMDTPGIDSTDEAHRIVTESALYLADACAT
jgi:ribosome biogenesis GTPase A